MQLWTSLAFPFRVPWCFARTSMRLSLPSWLCWISPHTKDLASVTTKVAALLAIWYMSAASGVYPDDQACKASFNLMASLTTGDTFAFHLWHKSKLVFSACGTLTGLPTVTDPIWGVYGQDLKVYLGRWEHQLCEPQGFICALCEWCSNVGLFKSSPSMPTGVVHSFVGSGWDESLPS